MPAISNNALNKDSEIFYRKLAEFVRLYQYRDRSCICYHDISVTQCHAIDALERLGALTLNELSEELHLDKSTSSRVVVALERKGYLKRKKDQSDGRALRLEVTKRGSNLHAMIENELIEEQKEMLKDFSDSERRAVIELISSLVERTRIKFGKKKVNSEACKV